LFAMLLIAKPVILPVNLLNCRVKGEEQRAKSQEQQYQTSPSLRFALRALLFPLCSSDWAHVTLS